MDLVKANKSEFWRKMLGIVKLLDDKSFLCDDGDVVCYHYKTIDRRGKNIDGYEGWFIRCDTCKREAFVIYQTKKELEENPEMCYRFLLSDGKLGDNREDK